MNWVVQLLLVGFGYLFYRGYTLWKAEPPKEPQSFTIDFSPPPYQISEVYDRMNNMFYDQTKDDENDTR